MGRLGGTGSISFQLYQMNQSVDPVETMNHLPVDDILFYFSYHYPSNTDQKLVEVTGGMFEEKNKRDEEEMPLLYFQLGKIRSEKILFSNSEYCRLCADVLAGCN